MEMTEVKETILSWDNMLSEIMKEYIHYQSMRNFLLHFDEIQSKKVQEKICILLSEYIEVVKANNYDFEREEGFQLARKYVTPIAMYYREYSNFVAYLRIRMILLFGILGDGLLYLTGMLPKIKNIPIVTIGLLLYYIFVITVKKSKGRVYGVFY